MKLSPQIWLYMTTSNIRLPVSTLMFERDKCFIGREDIIAEIDKCLLLESRVAIAGIGGVG